MLASHYPYQGDTTGVERHSSHRPADEGIPLLHGHTHSRDFGPHGSHEFHVGVDAFDFAPIPFELVDAWLADLCREDAGIAAIVRGRSDRETEPISEVALRLGAVALPATTPGGREETAMDIVHRAERGEISKAELADALIRWQYEPQYKTTGLADDWEHRPNSFDAVYYAFVFDLIDERTYDLIAQGLDGEDHQAR